MDKKQSIIQEIQRVATLVAPNVVTVRLFARHSDVSTTTVRYAFGSFSEALRAAGFTPNERGWNLKQSRSVLNDDELLDEIGKVWRQISKRPTESAYTAAARFSTTPYKRRWGTFGKAVGEYVSRFGEPETNTSSSDSSQAALPKREVPRGIVIPKTHKPTVAQRRERILYGEPIEFRGLRYAPINEQGVVYLFGMVSRELGFMIESVRTDYPDCEGKRALDHAGKKWQHVRIEFEYRSRNFLEHGHDPEECDLIVCWVHDWEACPLEVLELSRAIELLPKK